MTLIILFVIKFRLNGWIDDNFIYFNWFTREKAPEVVGTQDYVLNYLSYTDNLENDIDGKIKR